MRTPFLSTSSSRLRVVFLSGAVYMLRRSLERVSFTHSGKRNMEREGLWRMMKGKRILAYFCGGQE